jgi:hypothetical protein
MASADRSQTAIVVVKTYDLVLWLLPKVEKFPRSYRFSVGDRMVNKCSAGLAFPSPAAFQGLCLLQRVWKAPPARVIGGTTWKGRRVTIRTLRYTDVMSRLRRLQVTGKPSSDSGSSGSSGSFRLAVGWKAS